MYLSVIYLIFAVMYTFIPIFISRRRNLRLLITFSLLFVFMYFSSLLNVLDNYFNIISRDILNGIENKLIIRIPESEERLRFIYANIYLLFFFVVFVILYNITGLFIRNKSNFRNFSNMGIKTTLHVLMAIFNSISFYLLIALFFGNLNTYLNLEVGFLSYIFDIARRVVLRLWKTKTNYFSYPN